jgi:hypothetical protein
VTGCGSKQAAGLKPGVMRLFAALRHRGCSARVLAALLLVVLTVQVQAQDSESPCTADEHGTICSGHGQCRFAADNTTAEGCDCNEGYTGDNCQDWMEDSPDACKMDQYGLGCDQVCDMYDDCHGNGRCIGATGNCECFDGYTGPNCDGGGGPGPDDDACKMDQYGLGCEVKCDMDSDCNGNGRCIGATGNCECYEGYTGPSCGDAEELPDGQCPAGQEMADGVCKLCPIGFFKPSQGPEDCSQCPEHSMSLIDGSKSVDDCECDPGFMKEKMIDYLPVKDDSNLDYMPVDDSSSPMPTLLSWVCVEKNLEWEVPWHDGPDVMWLEDQESRVVPIFQLKSSFTEAPNISVSFVDGDQIFGRDPFAGILLLGQGNDQYAEVTLQADPDSFGHSVWTVIVTDQRGGETITQAKPLHITVLSVNDAPSYEAAEHSFFTSQDEGQVIENHWARNITAGPSNENDQQLSFKISQVTGPRGIAMAHISADGSLVFDLSDKLGYAGSGNTSWEVILMDDGGRLHLGVDKSEPRHISLEVFKRPALPKFLSLKQIETLRLSVEGKGHQGGQGVVSPPSHELLPSWPTCKLPLSYPL